MELYFIVLSLAAFSFLRGSCVVQDVPSDAVVTYGTTHTLTCRLQEGDPGFWNEVPDGGGEPFLIFSGSTLFRSDEKYNNFGIVGELPDYNMRIMSAAVDDEGTYQCATSQEDAHSAAFSVEVPPLDVNISCSSTTNCPADGEEFSSEVMCICKVIGAYPESLRLEWTHATPKLEVTTSPSSTGPQGSFDFMQNAVANITGNTGMVQCAVIGYVNNISEAVRKASYGYSSPECSLTAIPDRTTCNTAEFTCSCGNDEPKVSKWSLFSQSMAKIGESDDGTFADVDISANKTSTFYCRGCNGIYGEDSLASTTVICEPATTTPTMTLMTTFTPVKGQGLETYAIILIVLACVGAAGGTGFAVYWFGFRTSDQESVKRSNNEVGISTANKEKSDKLLYESTGNNFDPPGGADNNTVTASTNETTNSAAPVYGVVNKSTKKKSDNTDGNGVNSKLQSEPDQVEYAAVNKPKPDPQPAPRSSKPPGNNTEPEKVELQYADIDHSNRGRSNEIHQPADAPTEYATVQSVIV